MTAILGFGPIVRKFLQKEFEEYYKWSNPQLELTNQFFKKKGGYL